MRDWLKELDEIDRDCVHTYERFLRCKLIDKQEYIEIDSLTDECPMEFNTTKEFFGKYPEIKKRYYKMSFRMRA